MWALDWLICTEKVCVLADKWFTVSKNWLILGRLVPPGSASPQMSMHPNTENKNRVNIHVNRNSLLKYLYVADRT